MNFFGSFEWPADRKTTLDPLAPGTGDPPHHLCAPICRFPRSSGDKICTLLTPQYMIFPMGKSGTISIACASAFWGDTPLAVGQILSEKDLDFIVFDYLSEVTMALLARVQKKDPSAGYTSDFLTDAIEPHLAEISRRKIRLVANAGGLNPVALAQKIEEAAQRMNLNLKVIAVEGDDLRGSDHLSTEQKAFATANAYLGGVAIAQALDAGADIVITGRIVDTALVTGPLVHAFNKSWSDYDFLAQASLAGHVVECGTQTTGGNFTDWKSVPGRENVGFPIVRVKENGSFVVTKPPGTGGLISRASVAEQIVYEIGDPGNYLLPDVICDFSEVRIQELGEAQVEIHGAKGRAPTSSYKVSATKQSGFRLAALAYIAGGEAALKARDTGETILSRVKKQIAKSGGADFLETRIEVLGSGEDAVLRLSAAHERPEPLDLLAKEIAPGATSLAPGMASLLGGRAAPVPRMSFSSFLIEKSKVDVHLVTGSSRTPVRIESGTGQPAPTKRAALGPLPTELGETVTLEKLVYARSGDKGNHVNIGVIARDPKSYPLLRSLLTPEKIGEFFRKEFDGGQPHVEAWDLPGLFAINFLLHDCLAGGGAYSLKADPQGKAFAQRLLQMKLEIPKGVV